MLSARLFSPLFSQIRIPMNDKRFKIKELVTRKKKLQSKLERLHQEVNESKTEYSKTKAQIDKINNILSTSAKNLIVTEHALLKYIERFMDIDLEKIKKQIADKQIEDQAKTLGNGKYPTKDGLTLVVKNMTVVTLY